MIRYGWRRFILFDQRTAAGRKAAYLSNVLTSESFAKEVRVWGMGEFLLRQVLAFGRRARQENIQLSRHQSWATLAGETLSSLGYYSCYLVVVLAVAAGRLTVGGMTLYAGAFARMQSLFEAMLAAIANAYQVQLFAHYLEQFLALEPEIASVPTGIVAVPPAMPRRFERITIEALRFTYPDTAAPVIDGVNLTLRAGECVALIGANGAGKTTLVKLLLRLYDPSAGRIAIDGIDLRRFDPEAWRRQVGVIFQDYARFQLSAHENIAVGDLACDDPARIRAAAVAADIDGVLSALPLAYETLLGRQFEGGHELSLGQWQKVALARALLRDAPLLIMDEPTAAMDPQAEYELYGKLRQLARGRTTLLISHRFSTVRMADRILVLQGGKIVEEGSHRDLISGETLYARLFRLQAEGYQLPALPAGSGSSAGEPGMARSAVALEPE